MKLTEEQLGDIRIYLFKSAKYRETYAEVYDHVLNALETEDSVFDIGRVQHIIETDFGAFEQIRQHEEMYLKQMRGLYFRLMGREIGAAFRFPELWNSLLLFFLCVFLFCIGLRIPINSEPMVKSIGFILAIPGLYYLMRRYVVDRNQVKPSLKYDFMHIVWLGGTIVGALLIFILTKLNALFIAGIVNSGLIIGCYLLSAIYVRAFTRLYHKKLWVLTA